MFRRWSAPLALGFVVCMAAPGAHARHPRHWSDGSAVPAKALDQLASENKTALLTHFQDGDDLFLIACAKQRKHLACAALNAKGEIVDDSVRYQARQGDRGLELMFMVEIEGVQAGVQARVPTKGRKSVRNLGLDLKSMTSNGEAKLSEIKSARAFSPSAADKRLIAHELTHTVQQ